MDLKFLYVVDSFMAYILLKFQVDSLKIEVSKNFLLQVVSDLANLKIVDHCFLVAI